MPPKMSDATPPVAAPETPVLTGANDNALAFAFRRIRELALDAQNKSGSGHIFVDLLINDGKLTRDIRVHPNWTERL